jgi:hypothetical protein
LRPLSDTLRVIDALISASSRGAVRLALSSLSQAPPMLFENIFTTDPRRIGISSKRREAVCSIVCRSKLFPAGDTFSTLRSRELIHGSVANLTHDDVVVVEHGKPECSSFLVVSFDFVTDQAHGQDPAGAYTGAPECIGPSIKSTGSAQGSNAAFYRVVKLSHKARSGVDLLAPNRAVQWHC